MFVCYMKQFYVYSFYFGSYLFYTIRFSLFTSTWFSKSASNRKTTWTTRKHRPRENRFEPQEKLSGSFLVPPNSSSTHRVAIFYPFSQFCEITISLPSLQRQPTAAPDLFQRGVEYGMNDTDTLTGPSAYFVSAPR